MTEDPYRDAWTPPAPGSYANGYTPTGLQNAIHNEPPKADGDLSFARGFRNALPMALVLWGVIWWVFQ